MIQASGRTNVSCCDAMSLMENEVGTVVELWRSAIGLYPEVVDKYGEFSSEMLQAMLGIPLLGGDTKRVPSSEALPATVTETPMRALRERTPPDTNGRPDILDEKRDAEASMQLDQVYASLPPETQAVIFSGLVGHPVRASSISDDAIGLKDAVRTDGHANFYFNVDQEGRKKVPPQSCDGSRRVPSVRFELDAVLDSEERQTDVDHLSMLIEPNAPLIRSMRRCERRLLPLLNHWTVVDVVMTEFEVVYFDVTGVDETNDATSGSFTGSMQQRRASVRSALVATKGGKRLRLRDVAACRKIVGHFDLRSIDLVKVQRYLAPPVVEGRDVDEDDKALIQEEYWKPRSSTEESKNALTDPVLIRASNTKRWERVQEDQLKINSPQGVLYLRFFADLEEMEMSPSVGEAAKGKIYKNEALLWCQTLARLCGAEQLKQKLPSNVGEVER